MTSATMPPDLIDRYDITELLGITMLQFGSFKKKSSFSAARERCAMGPVCDRTVEGCSSMSEALSNTALALPLRRRLAAPIGTETMGKVLRSEVYVTGNRCDRTWER